VTGGKDSWRGATARPGGRHRSSPYPWAPIKTSTGGAFGKAGGRKAETSSRGRAGSRWGFGGGGRQGGTGVEGGEKRRKGGITKKTSGRHRSPLEEKCIRKKETNTAISLRPPKGGTVFYCFDEPKEKLMSFPLLPVGVLLPHSRSLLGEPS